MRTVHPKGTIQSDSVTGFDDYHTKGGMLIKTESEGQAVADALGKDSVVMLRGHGAVVVGESIEQVVVKSLKLEYNSRLLYQQSLVGEPWYPPTELVESNVDDMLSEGQIVKTLDYYFSEL